LIEIGNNDLGAFAREGEGDFLADTACSSRNNGDLVPETQGAFLSFIGTD